MEDCWVCCRSNESVAVAMALRSQDLPGCAETSRSIIPFLPGSAYRAASASEKPLAT